MTVLQLDDIKKSFLSICIFTFLLICPAFAEELEQETNPPTQNIPIVTGFLYGVQKYSGFNCFVNFLAETSVKTVMKFKTHARNINCDVEIYSGWDLIKKKAKSFHLDAEELRVKKVPVEYFEVTVPDPIYFRKNQKRKNKIVYPININSQIIINPASLIEILDNMAKSRGDLGAHEVELPLPPFGNTKVILKDLMAQINENGLVQSSLDAVSAVNPDSEPLKAMFTGNIVVSDKKLLISNLECEIEDIFTKDSDVSMSFCDAVGELVNPVINFHKYEKRGITIDNVELSFPQNKLGLKVNLMLSPEGTNGKN